MNIWATLFTTVFFIVFVAPLLSQAIVLLILCIPVYMLFAAILPTGGRAPSTTRQGGDRNANSGETEQ